MRRIGKFASLAAIVLLPTLVLANDRMAEVADQFERQNYQRVLGLLDDRLSGHPRYPYYRGLAFYHLPDHASALPILERLYGDDPNDLEVLAALTDTLRTQGHLERAAEHANRLIAAGDDQRGHLLQGRIAEDRDQWAEAVTHYRAAAQGPDSRLIQQAARTLTDLHHRRGQHELAVQVAERAVGQEPDPLTALHFESMRVGRSPERRQMAMRLGYRLEHDDNVPQVPGNGGLFGISGESGLRHVLTGDFAFERPLSSRLSLFTEAYAYQSLHQDSDLNEFNFTRLRGVAGLGGNWGRGGWRVPLELGWSGLDGDRYQNTISLVPGVFVQPTGGWLIHLFARLSHDDFARPVRPSEDQGGDSWRLGLFLHAKPLPQLQWRLITEFGADDSDGRNWERDEWRVYSLAEYRFDTRLSGGIGFQYRDRNFENIHDVFLRPRQDEVWEGFVTLSWQFNENWRLRAQYSYQRQDSTIGVFEFTRNVFSLGASWEF